MSQRFSIWTVATVATLIILLLLGTASIAFGTPAAQLDPTQQQQTIDAVIAERFTQTAAAEQGFAMTQTAAVATVAAPTLTAAFEQTVDAAFNQALTATAEGQLTATAQAQAAPRQQVTAWLNGLADTLVTQITDMLRARQAEVTALENAAHATFLSLVQTAPSTAEFGERQASAVALLEQAQSQNPALGTLSIYNTQGVVLASTQAERIGATVAGEAYFAASLSAPQPHPVQYDPLSGAPTLTVTTPITDESGAAFGVLAAQIDLSALDALLRDATAQADHGVAIYAVSTAEGRLVAPAGFAELSGYPVLQSEGIAMGMAGQSSSGQWANFTAPPTQVLGVVRALPQWGVALLLEVPADTVSELAAVLPSPTPTPAPGTPTPLPALFPTNVVAEVAIAEETFEHGRMIWFRHNRQIWVMVEDDDPATPGGDWYCYNDTFQEGEPEIDPELVPPEGMFQPRRGFGKLWRTHPDLQERLGWALTPEFELTSQYTYIAGGYVENGQYIPGPGEHRLTTLDGQRFSFFEREIRGDCIGGLWRPSTSP